jgi:hypothetical protein
MLPYVIAAQVAHLRSAASRPDSSTISQGRLGNNGQVRNER